MATVEVTQGTLSGLEENGVFHFLGVPYAEPPLDERRFRAPLPKEPWPGIRAATSFSSPAVQTPMDPSSPRTVQGSEDCLYLNVWTPSLGGRLPVVVWVHGGAFVMGDGNLDGAPLASAGCVMVSVNYRIGPFGYLFLDDIAPGVVDSNLALRDLILAIEWIRENISSFGGDPYSLILTGESSGAMTAGALLATPACEGVFSAAWLMSGACRQVRDRDTATKSARVFLRAAGLTSNTASQVASLSTDDIVNAARVLAERTRLDEEFDAEVVLPVYGDEVLPRHPMDALRHGAARQTVLAVSWTLKDMGLFRKFDPVDGGKNKELFARRLVGDVRFEELAEMYQSQSTDWYVDLLTDFHFAVPALRAAEAQCEAGGVALVGRFDRTPHTAPWPEYGPVHTVDMFYLFTALSEPRGIAGIAIGSGMLPEDRETATFVRNLLISLVSHHPQSGSSAWPQYNVEGRPTLLFGETPHVETDPDSYRRVAWSGLLERP